MKRAFAHGGVGLSLVFWLAAAEAQQAPGPRFGRPAVVVTQPPPLTASSLDGHSRCRCRRLLASATRRSACARSSASPGMDSRDSASDRSAVARRYPRGDRVCASPRGEVVGIRVLTRTPRTSPFGRRWKKPVGDRAGLPKRGPGACCASAAASQNTRESPTPPCANARFIDHFVLSAPRVAPRPEPRIRFRSVRLLGDGSPSDRLGHAVVVGEPAKRVDHDERLRKRRLLLDRR